jgi:pyruvate, orthophosphate dikinase
VACITTEAGRELSRKGSLPDGLDDELAAAVADLEVATGRRFGASTRPLAVSVRSGAAVSMPGVMATILNVGAPTGADTVTAPDDPWDQLRLAVAAVFSSWDAPRARTYRELNGISSDLGTAVTVQAMVYGTTMTTAGRASRSAAIRTPASRYPSGRSCLDTRATTWSPGGC